MEFKEASDDDLQMTGHLAQVVRDALARSMPPEDEFPGSSSLAVTALVWVAGEMLRYVPAEQQASVLAHFQQQLADALAGDRHRTH